MGHLLGRHLERVAMCTEPAFMFPGGNVAWPLQGLCMHRGAEIERPSTNAWMKKWRYAVKRDAGVRPAPSRGVQGWRACPHAQPGCPTRGASPAEPARQLHLLAYADVSLGFAQVAGVLRQVHTAAETPALARSAGGRGGACTTGLRLAPDRGARQLLFATLHRAH